MKRRPTIGDWAIGAILSIWAVAILLPVYNVIVVSLSTEIGAIRARLPLWPRPFDFTSYKWVLLSGAIKYGFRNTLILLVVGVPYTMFLSTSLAYSLAKKLPGMSVVSFLLIATLYFGGGLIPFYLVVRNLGLVNSIFSMILPHGATVFYVIILRNFFQNVPPDIEESAFMDGASDIRIYAQIILPISTPILVTIGLFVAVNYWNEWWHSLLFISEGKKQSLQLVLRSILMEVTQLTSTVPEDYDISKLYNNGIRAAVVVITTAPIAALYPFLQKYFVRGLTSGALKF
ncbi:MAG: carbohydrate ABC transporter permease [Spirochaetales bacterium]|jgi:putative aldouronate transport system permease protein|nr:carbohydrate ABC transporter permease [Spirochaetales bacterium]